MKRGRPPKPKTPDLSVLERYPDMVAAFNYLGLSLKVVGGERGSFEKAAKPDGLGEARPLLSASAQAPIVLDTPERREWAQQQADIAAAVQAERAKTAPKTLPAAQQKAIAEGFLVDHAGRKAALKSQFQHDGEPAGAEPIAATERIETMSEAT